MLGQNVSFYFIPFCHNMSNNIATDSYDRPVRKKRFLEADKDGFPIQQQVPKTITNYTSAGNETINMPKTDIFAVNSTLASGDLTISISTAELKNLVGRTCHVIIDDDTTNDVIFNITAPAIFVSSGLENGTQTKTIAAGGIGAFILVFQTSTKVGVI